MKNPLALVQNKLFGRAPDSSSADSICCIGHSHLWCVERAAAQMGLALAAINFWAIPRGVIRENGAVRLAPEVERRLRAPTFSFVGGASHNMMGLAVHPRPFDFVLAEAPNLPLQPGAEIIPLEAVRAALLVETQEYLEIIGAVRSRVAGPMYHMEPPPPFADEQTMAKTVIWPHHPGRLHQVAPRSLRYKLWRLHSAMVQEFCATKGIVFVDHPVESEDADGFLAPEYYKDCVHANEAYGALVIEQMRSKL